MSDALDWLYEIVSIKGNFRDREKAWTEIRARFSAANTLGITEGIKRAATKPGIDYRTLVA